MYNKNDESLGAVTNFMLKGREHNTKKLRREERGITLIALIVTIVVLIILAVISINIVFGEDGIIQRAERGEEAHKSGARNDQIAIDKLDDLIDDVITDKTASPLDKLTTIQNSKVVAKDSEGVKIVIPKGFKVRTDLGTKASEGIVIEDANGNQFVWVPCTVTGKEGLTPYAQDKKYNDGTEDDAQSNYTQYTDWTDVGNEASVKANGGFYVARFEAGIPSTASFYPDADNTYIQSGRDTSTVIPVSKAGSPSWNYISQQNAVKVSTKMYEGNDTVESRLIDSYAWDTIVNWMAGSGVNVKNSTSYGNYYNSTTLTANGLYAEHIQNDDLTSANNDTWTRATNYGNGSITLGGELLEETAEMRKSKRIEIGTGTAEGTKVKNIYDMAGNMWEWTTETGRHNVENGVKYAVLRGGSFDHYGYHYPVSYRYGYHSTTINSFSLGFRVALYVK